MKLKKHRGGFYFVVLASLAFGQASAQYSMKKHSINNGSTTMQGSVYELSSSIAQVDASNTLTGSNYELRAGFWTEAITLQNNDLIFKDSFE